MQGKMGIETRIIIRDSNNTTNTRVDCNIEMRLKNREISILTQNT
jgi:hypothetical protein